MSGLNTSLYIGVEALSATQAAIEATSNNIANANTPGYTREVPQFSENAQTVTGGQVLGGGVSLDGLQSVRDELLNIQIQQQTSSQSSYDTASGLLQQVQSSFATSGGDVGTALSSFASSLTQLSANPSSAAAREQILTSGNNLANAFNSTATGLSQVQSEANNQVTQTVAQINTLTKQIAQLNGEVAQSAQTGKDGGTIQDQRDQLVQQLSKLTGISISQSTDGETITTANGSPLVIGSNGYSLQTSTASDGMQHVVDANGNDITSTIQGGQLGGAIQVRDQVIPGYLMQLNTLASQFGAAFNSAQAAGFDANGNPGQSFFTIPATGAAAGIKVAISDPSLVAASSDGTSGSNGNVANLSASLSNALPSGQTAAAAYSQLVYNVGSDASNASTQSSAIGQSLLQLTNQQGAVSGVSIDEETTNLIRFQTAYEAAARVISTIQQLNSVTINMVS